METFLLQDETPLLLQDGTPLLLENPMATMTITLAQSCASQGHLRLEITGARTGTIRLHASDILDQTLDDDALIEFLKTYLKIWQAGRTPLQVRNSLQAGLTVTI